MRVTFFKEARPSAKVQRALRKRERDNDEEAEKRKVRVRDRGCRFPLCGCRRLGLALEVSHNEHKGMGGNPDRSRSKAPLMMQMCRERHKANPFSVHNRAISWEPLNVKLGADGPVKWMLDVALLRYYLGERRQRPADVKLVEVCREATAGRLMFGQPEGEAKFLLEQLAEMKL